MDMPLEITSPLHRAFLQNVRLRREGLGLTQRDVAQKMGVSQPSYAKLENGRYMPSLEILEKVADALNVNPIQLLLLQ